MPKFKSKEEFARAIKQKYPQYANIADAELADKIIAKYPQYKNEIELATAAPVASHPSSSDDPTFGSALREGVLGFSNAFGAESKTPVRDVASGMLGNSTADAARRDIASGHPVKGYTEAALSGVPILGPLVSGALFGGEQLADQARQSFATGHPVQGARQLALSVPGVSVIGPAVESAYNDVATGIENRDANQVMHGIGTGLGLGVQAVTGAKGEEMPAMPKALQAGVDALKDRVSTAVRPVVQDAMGFGPSWVREKGKHYIRVKEKVDNINAKRSQTAYDANTKTFGEAKAKQLKAQEDYANEVQRINQENADLKARGEQRTQLEQQLQAASQQLEQKIADAKTNAKAANDAQWDAVRAKTAGVTTDIGPLSNAVEQASQIADPNTSALFRSITNAAETEPRPVVIGGQEVPPSNPNYAKFYEIQYGEPPALGSQAPVTFDTLQRWYNYLGNRMYGTNAWMDAGKWQAFNIVRDALNERMQTIAQQAGADADLAAARTSHTNMMETFHDAPTTDRSVAAKVLSEANPDYVKAQASADRMAKLGRYDASIADHVKSIQDIRNQIAGLPDKDAVAKGTKTLPQQPTDIPSGEAKTPNLKSLPKEDIQAARQDLAEKWMTRYKTLSSIQLVGLMSGVASLPLRAIFPDLHTITGYVGGLGGVIALKQIAMEMADSDGFMKWVSSPTAKDVNILKKLPSEALNDIRNNVQRAVEEQKARGKDVKVSPSLTSIIGPVTVGALSASEQRRNAAQQKQDLADIRKKYQTQPTSNPAMPHAER